MDRRISQIKGKTFAAVELVVTLGLGRPALGQIDFTGLDEIQYAGESFFEAPTPQLGLRRAGFREAGNWLRGNAQPTGIPPMLYDPAR
jgi:hypothetical protein